MSEGLKKGWTKVAFGDVVRLVKERSSDPEADGFKRYVGLEHLDPGELKIYRWGDVADGTTFTSVFRAGQVLFGKRRAYQRKLALADFDGVCSGDIYVFEPKNSQLMPELLPFICQTDNFFEHAIGTSAGSLSPRTNWKSLAEYEFALPPMEEQRQIAQIYKLLNVYKDKLLQLTNSTIKNLDSLTRFAYNRSHHKLYETKKYFDVNPDVLTNDQLISSEIWKYADLGSVIYPLTMDNLKELKLSEAPSRARRIAMNGDILVSTVRPNLKGHLLLSALDSPIVASTGFTVLRTKEQNLSSIMIGILLSTHFSSYCESRVYGTSYPAIRPADVEEYLVPDLKSLEEKGFNQIYASVINNFLLAKNRYENVSHDFLLALNKEVLEL